MINAANGIFLLRRGGWRAKLQSQMTNITVTTNLANQQTRQERLWDLLQQQKQIGQSIDRLLSEPGLGTRPEQEPGPFDPTRILRQGIS